MKRFQLFVCRAQGLAICNELHCLRGELQGFKSREWKAQNLFCRTDVAQGAKNTSRS
jgi:hypothetical protein